MGASRFYVEKTIAVMWMSRSMRRDHRIFILSCILSDYLLFFVCWRYSCSVTRSGMNLVDDSPWSLQERRKRSAISPSPSCLLDILAFHSLPPATANSNRRCNSLPFRQISLGRASLRCSPSSYLFVGATLYITVA